MDNQVGRRVLVASPRGFCAGVERAIEIVERLLARGGAPLWVRREIVHNQAVVEDFSRRGVVFVEELDEVPDGATVVFSAHGIAPEVREVAQRRRLRAVDATCPLVSKVHAEVVRNTAAGRHTVLIGHAGHDEVLGTLGEAPDSISLVTDAKDAETVEIPAGRDVSYVTQTTLSLDETAGVVEVLRRRFPSLRGPKRSDICFATQNRQNAVKALVAEGIEHLLVVGSVNSSNSRRLCEVAEGLGVPATLIDDVDGLPPGDFEGLRMIGLTAGASAPEHLLRSVVEHLRSRGWVDEDVAGVEEKVVFPLPKEVDGGDTDCHIV